MLQPGACLIKNGVPLKLLYRELADAETETWRCELLFVASREATFTFSRGERFSGIHGTQSFLA
jgi:hypothetical protein